MSSPIALKKKSFVHKAFVNLHQLLSHKRRVSILSEKISELIKNEFPDIEVIRCVDVGCGDMQIAENIGMHNPKTAWNCIDIHNLPENASDRWDKYNKFDGINIPYDDKSMDVVLFCDVLHHDQDNAPHLLRDAGRVGRRIIVKDHFEYSFYSRLMLRLMDIIGNWGYGIKIPERYFTIQSFKEVCLSSGLTVIRVEIDIDLYPKLLRFILRPKWQFIAVLES